MTREEKDNWARVCANLTDDLPSKIKTIGKAIAEQMAITNAATADGVFLPSGVMDGMIDTLMFLGIPYQVHKDGDAYRAMEIAGEMFPVPEQAQARPVCPSGDFGCPHYAESGHCTLDDPAHECDDYMYYNGTGED